MVTNLVVLLILCAVAVLALWFAWKLRKRHNSLLKWGGTAFVGLIGILVVTSTALATMGFIKIYAPRGNEVREVTVAGTPAQIERGRQIAYALCSGCHTLEPHELPLTGGENILADIPMPLGSAMPPNLTPAGRIDEWTDGQLQRAIREGTYPNGHLMPIMSAQAFRNFSQDDLDSLVAFLRSQPSTEGTTPRQQLTVLTLAFQPLGMLPLRDAPDSNVPPPAVPIGPTAAYGQYVVGFLNCAECHGENLTGGKGGLLPKGPSLAAAAAWTPGQFIDTIRTGVDPGGMELDPDKMPWKEFARLDDTTLTAVHEYLDGVFQ